MQKKPNNTRKVEAMHNFHGCDTKNKDNRTL